jgi:hypothetical protein
MRCQLTFLTQAYGYSGARMEDFVHKSTGEVRGKEGKMEKVPLRNFQSSCQDLDNERPISLETESSNRT